jgi:phosphatidylserine/phosphatidylglycerophosphate/cardiolipin synthase-like enzyme
MKAKKISKKKSSSKSKAKLVVNEDYLPVLLKFLPKAKKTIDIMAFSWGLSVARGEISGKGAPYEIVKALIDLKAKRGKTLRIRLFTEGQRETYERNKITADHLKEHGVEVRFGSTHAKGFCIDEKILYFGSTNLTNQSIMKNNEANLLIEDKKIASEFMRYFEYHWKGGEHGGIKLKLPMLADGDFEEAIIKMIDSAKRRIDFSIYFFDDRDIENALIRAHERGVKVKGFIHQHNSFALSYIWRNRSTAKRMRNAGIEDLHFSVPTKFSHAKFIVVDGKECALGTGNWLKEDVHIHPQLYVQLKDPVLSKALIKYLDWEIKNQSFSRTSKA